MFTPSNLFNILSLNIADNIGGGSAGLNYPNRPIRIVTNELGGVIDFTARLIAQELAQILGQPVNVENKPNGTAPGETVSKAPADGYTLLLYGSVIWIGPFMQVAPYDSAKDFAPISLTTRCPTVLVVHPSLPVQSVGELIALAKAKPGQLSHGSTGTGTANHLAAELFKAMAGVDIARVNFKGGVPALTDLMKGKIHLMMPSAVAVAPHVKSGKLRALAVTGAQPSSLFPHLPTVAGAGLPGYESTPKYGMFAPAGTPSAIIEFLHQNVVQVLSSATIRAKFLAAGVEVVASTPAQFLAEVRAEMDKMASIVGRSV